jgi:hypothetical protein
MNMKRRKTMERKLFHFIAYSILAICLYVMPKTVYASPWRSPLITSFYGHYTDARFDKANADGTLITPYENWVPLTEHYEWKDIDPHFHAIPGLGFVSYWYEAKDSDVNPQWHYVMNDFVGRTINLGGVLDNWFEWSGGGSRWHLKIYGEGNLYPLWIWKDGNIVYDSGFSDNINETEISGAYKYDISPLMPNQSHTIFELAIPYDISPPLRDMIWFGDPLTSGDYYSYVPAPSALLLLCSGLAGIVGLRRKRLLK